VPFLVVGPEIGIEMFESLFSPKTESAEALNMKLFLPFRDEEGNRSGLHEADLVFARYRTNNMLMKRSLRWREDIELTSSASV